MRVHEMARILDQATLEAREIERLTVRYPDLTLEEAYRIQEEGIRLRCERGEKVVGWKMGLTSKAKMEQMGLHTPIYGVLMDAMHIPDGSVYRMRGSIHPKIEPEIAFRISRDVRGKLRRGDVKDVVSEVFPALEILDSRFLNFKYFSLPDVVADNSSSSRFIPSAETRRYDPDFPLDRLELRLEVDGKTAHVAGSDAILGDPVNSLIHLSELLEGHGKVLAAGSIVLAGAATQAVPLAGEMKIRLEVQGLGAVSVLVNDEK